LISGRPPKNRSEWKIGRPVSLLVLKLNSSACPLASRISWLAPSTLASTESPACIRRMAGSTCSAGIFR
jgi:Tfp pilus assembly protein PilZ